MKINKVKLQYAFIISSIGFLVLNALVTYIVETITRLTGKELDPFYSTNLKYLNFYQGPMIKIFTWPIVTLMFLFAIIFIYYKLAKKDSVKNKYGDSRFASLEEIKNDSDVQVFDYPNIKEPGMLIFREDKNDKAKKLYLDTAPVHNLIIGTTRGGKGQSVILPQLDIESKVVEISKKRSLILGDFKGELYTLMSKQLVDAGYDVHVFNLINPSRSMGMNSYPALAYEYLDEENGGMTSATMQVQAIAYTMNYNPEAKDPTWNNASESLVQALLFGLIEDWMKNFPTTDEVGDEIYMLYDSVGHIQTKDNWDAYTIDVSSLVANDKIEVLFVDEDDVQIRETQFVLVSNQDELLNIIQSQDNYEYLGYVSDGELSESVPSLNKVTENKLKLVFKSTKEAYTVTITKYFSDGVNESSDKTILYFDENNDGFTSSEDSEYDGDIYCLKSHHIKGQKVTEGKLHIDKVSSDMDVTLNYGIPEHMLVLKFCDEQGQLIKTNQISCFNYDLTGLTMPGYKIIRFEQEGTQKPILKGTLYETIEITVFVKVNDEIEVHYINKRTKELIETKYFSLGEFKTKELELSGYTYVGYNYNNGKIINEANYPLVKEGIVIYSFNDIIDVHDEKAVEKIKVIHYNLDTGEVMIEEYVDKKPGRIKPKRLNAEYVGYKINKQVVKQYITTQHINIYTALHMLTNYDSEGIKRYFDSRPLDSVAKMKYGAALKSGEKTLGSILMNTLTNCQVFTTTGVSQMMAMDSINYESIGMGDKPVAIFLLIPEEAQAMYKVATLFINDIYNALIRVARLNNNKLKRDVHFILDEFGNLPPIPNFATKVTSCLQFGIRFTIATQSYAQIEKLYGDKDAVTILGNIANEFFVLSKDEATVKKFIASLGTRTEIKQSKSKRSGSIVSESSNESLEKIELLNTGDLFRLSKDYIYINRLRKYPIKFKTLYAYKYLKLGNSSIGDIPLVRMNMNTVIHPALIKQNRTNGEMR